MSLQPSESERSIGSRDLTSWRSRPGRWLRQVFGALAERLRNTELAVLVLLALAGALAVGGTMLAGEIYEAVVAGSSVALLDRPVLDWMTSVRTPTLNAVIATFSASGGQLWMSVITGIAITVVCLRWRRWTPLVLMLITVGGSLGMTVAGKRLTDRARPPLAESIPPPETSASFPLRARAQLDRDRRDVLLPADLAPDQGSRPRTRSPCSCSRAGRWDSPGWPRASPG